MSRRPGNPEPQWRRMLRAIEEAGRPLSSIELADALNLLPSLPRQRRQARINQITYEAAIYHAGYFRVAALGRSGYRGSPFNLWDITDAGREALAQPWPVVAKSTLEKQERAARVAAAKARRAALPGLAEERGWDFDTPIPQRRAAARELRDAGHTLDDIGWVFGRTRELIRLDLLPSGEREAIRETTRQRNHDYYYGLRHTTPRG